MSEDANYAEIRSGYYCTCCGVRGQCGESGCSCADTKCPVCPQCVLCCKTPNLHRSGYRRLSEASAPKVYFTAEDRAFLSQMRVGSNDDNRKVD